MNAPEEKLGSYGWTDGPMDERMDGWIDGRMDGWMDEQMDGQS